MEFERKGIAKRWRSKKAVINRLRVDLDSERNQTYLKEIAAYNNRREADLVGPVPKDVEQQGQRAVSNWLSGQLRPWCRRVRERETK